MDSDLSQIAVLPIAFEHGLIHPAKSLTGGQAKIVAIGLSTTAGEGNITAYPRAGGCCRSSRTNIRSTRNWSTGASALAKIVMEPSSTEASKPAPPDVGTGSASFGDGRAVAEMSAAFPSVARVQLANLKPRYARLNQM
jgi:hypothetical protein